MIKPKIDAKSFEKVVMQNHPLDLNEGAIQIFKWEW